MTVRLPAPGPIAGALSIPGTLPAGFAHPHASEEARLIAEADLILRVQVGSGVHGTAITGQENELSARHFLPQSCSPRVRSILSAFTLAAVVERSAGGWRRSSPR